MKKNISELPHQRRHDVVQIFQKNAFVDYHKFDCHSTECPEEGIRRVTDCQLSHPGDNRLYRQVLVTSAPVDGCRCGKPRSTVLTEACQCPEAEQPPVRQLQRCAAGCAEAEDERCDEDRCHDVFVWQRFVYATGKSAERHRCRAEEIKRIRKPCCESHQADKRSN